MIKFYIFLLVLVVIVCSLIPCATDFLSGPKPTVSHQDFAQIGIESLAPGDTVGIGCIVNIRGVLKVWEGKDGKRWGMFLVGDGKGWTRARLDSLVEAQEDKP